MNVFTTDHPMVSQASCFDRKAHRTLSFICTVFAIAFMLFPALFGWLFYELSDLPETTGEQLTFDQALILAGLTLVFCCLCAGGIVSLHRLFVRFTGRYRVRVASKQFSK